MAEIINPHDRFVREVLSQPETAADFLANYLPPEIAAALDLSVLELVKDSFIDESLRQHFSDMLYRTRLQDGPEVFIYLLFEHKSEQEQLTGFQLLRYKVRIWERAPRRKPNKLPLIIPLVLYHGGRRWTAPTQFSQLLDAGTGVELQRFLVSFEFHLIDLSQYDLETLKGNVQVLVLLALLRYIFESGGLRERLPDIVELLSRMERLSALEYLKRILSYLSYTAEDLDQEVLRMEIQKKWGKEAWPIVAPFALEMIEEGRQESRRTTAIQIALRLLTVKFGSVSAEAQAAINVLSAEQAESLAEKTLGLQTSEELHAWLLQTLASS